MSATPSTGRLLETNLNCHAHPSTVTSAFLESGMSTAEACTEDSIPTFSAVVAASSAQTWA